MIDADDFKGVSGYTYPLLKGIQDAFVSRIVNDTFNFMAHFLLFINVK